MQRQLYDPPSPPEDRAEKQAERESPFHESLDLLLNIACQETVAVGFALYEHDQSRGELIHRCGRELPPREPGSFSALSGGRPVRVLSHANGSTLVILSYCLRGQTGLAGVLDFGFRDPHKLTPDHLEILDAISSAIEAIFRFSQNTGFLLRHTARIKQLQAELADLKISERARGLALQQTRLDRAKILSSHVGSVLSNFQLEGDLEAQVQELERRRAERQVVAHAKSLLERREGFTEEEAYAVLRAASRRSRKRLIDVAGDLLMGEDVLHNR